MRARAGQQNSFVPKWSCWTLENLSDEEHVRKTKQLSSVWLLLLLPASMWKWNYPEQKLLVGPDTDTGPFTNQTLKLTFKLTCSHVLHLVLFVRFIHSSSDQSAPTVRSQSQCRFHFDAKTRTAEEVTAHARKTGSGAASDSVVAAERRRRAIMYFDQRLCTVQYFCCQSVSKTSDQSVDNETFWKFSLTD